MTSRGPSLVVSNRVPVQRGTGPAQMSLPAPIGPRRVVRQAPRPAALTLCPELVRARLAEGWPRLMLAKFADDASCGEFFGRTRQAASYWRSGHCKPDGAAMALAFLRWPAECEAMLQGVR